MTRLNGPFNRGRDVSDNALFPEEVLAAPRLIVKGLGTNYDVYQTQKKEE